MTIYEAHGKYYLPVGQGLREISSYEVCQWIEHGEEIKFESIEVMV